MEQKTTLVECPRDALQGYSKWVPTEKKIAYYQSLLKVGFSILDCGSFVSPKAVPQMADTAEVINRLDCSHSPTQLLTIVANVRGAEEAVKFDKISYIGYPLSISENFQMRNTGKTIQESIPIVKEIIRLAKQDNNQVVVYLSMAFGNPFGDQWH
ncbi:MAG: hydroxymethylglutaryl-CoA lyase, partial [Flavobacteriaceae bacterium]